MRIRCNLCKKRKKRCTGDSEKCDYCLKLGVDCEFDVISNFAPKRKTNIKKPLTKVALLEFVNSLCKKSIIPQLEFTVCTSICIPSSKVLSGIDSSLMIIDDVETLPVQKLVNVDKDSLMGYLLSTLRVKRVENRDSLLKISIDHIKEMLAITQNPSLFKNLEDNFILGGTKNIMLADFKSPVTYDSFDSVYFNADFSSLNDFFGIEPIGFDPFTSRIADIHSIDKSLELKLFSAYLENNKENEYTIFLPIIIGSHINLGCCLIYSNYSYFNGSYPLDSAHLLLLSDLQQRLIEFSSFGCDHTLLAVLYLLRTEIKRGFLKNGLYQKLLNLSKKMIILRGGIRSICENLTGKVLMKLFVVHLCVENVSDFFGNDYIPYNDMLYVFDLKLKWWKTDETSNIKLFARITHLYNLTQIACGANYDLDNINFGSLEKVIEEGENLEVEILKLIKIDNESPILKCALLYLYGSVYRNSPFSIKTTLVKSSVNIDALLLTDYILPIFIYGTNLTTITEQKIFEQKLLSSKPNSKLFQSCLEMLEKFWTSDHKNIDWRELAFQENVTIPFKLD